MQYDAKDAKEYLELLKEDWRKEKLLEVRQMILAYGPELEESIRYKMLNFGKDEEYPFALNAQKNYVSLYVGTIDKIDNAHTLLKPFNCGKGCIRITKSINLKDTNLDEFIKTTIEMWRAGEDIDC